MNENLNEPTPLFIASRTTIIVVMVTLGVIGNVYVLWFYGRNKKLTGQVYILMLAVIDLISCVVILPQVPVFEQINDQDKQKWSVLDYVFHVESSLELVSYFAVQVAMAIDQLIAVTSPFLHVRLRQNLNRVMLGVGGGTLGIMTGFGVGLVLLEAPPFLFRITFVIMGLVCVVVLMIVYPITAYKLYLQNASIQPKAQPQLPNGGPSAQNNPQTAPASTEETKSIMHKQALKIYTAILVQFMIFTLLCVIGDVVFYQRWAVYFFFFNHIGNPVIYYLFVPKFRDGVKENARKLFCRK